MNKAVILDHLDVEVYAFDAGEKLVYFNQKSADQSGISADPDIRLKDLIAEDAYPDFIRQIVHARQKGKVAFETQLVRRPGKGKTSVCLFYLDDLLIMQIQEDQSAYAMHRLERSVQEKNLLLRELHHRVKNNLQTISSTLYIKSVKSSNEAVRSFLTDISSNIRAISMIHEKLLRANGLSDIPMQEYLEGLAMEILRSQTPANLRIEQEIEIERVNLNMDFAVNCGMILTELLSNVIKHAFPERKDGKLQILFKRKDLNFVLRVLDDGVGFGSKKDGIGLELIRALAERYQGRVSILRKAGNGVKVVMKYE